MKSTFHHLVRTHYRYIMMARVVIFGDWTASFHLGWHAKGKLDEPLLLCSENHVINVYHRSPVLCIAAPLGHVSTLRDQCTLQSNPCFYFFHTYWACSAIKFRLLQCHFSQLNIKQAVRNALVSFRRLCENSLCYIFKLLRMWSHDAAMVYRRCHIEIYQHQLNEML